jgi:hypothetical protein
MDGTGLGQAYRTLCPNNYYCPAGTGDHMLGTIANDAINRGLSTLEANPYYDMKYVRYIDNDDVRVLSKHDKNCLDGIDIDLNLRYELFWAAEFENQNNPYIGYLSSFKNGKAVPYTNDSLVTGINDGAYYRPTVYNRANKRDTECGRDHKWRLVDQAIRRKECDCVRFFKVVIAVYRLWKCTSDGTMQSLGIASISPPYNGGRDVWFNRRALNTQQCTFNDDTGSLNLTNGRIDFDPLRPFIGEGSGSNGLLDLTSNVGIEFQITWRQSATYTSYGSLRSDVQAEYILEVAI